MKLLVILATAAGLLMWGGCKSPAFNSSISSQSPSDLNISERLSRNKSSDDSSAQSAGVETLSSKDFRSSAALSPKAVEVNLRLGHLEARMGHFEKAKRYYSLVLRSDPDNVTAHHRLAVMADKQRDFGTAQQHYLAAQRKDPSDPELLADLGYSYFLQNKFQESEAYLNSALQNDPTHQRTLNNLGLLYGTMGDYNRALEVLRRTGSETEARQKLAKLFPGGVPQTSPGDGLPATLVSSSSGNSAADFYGTPQPMSSNPLASSSPSATELTAPDPRNGEIQNPAVMNSRVRRFLNRQGASSPGGNFAPAETTNPSANPAWPSEQSTIATNPVYPSDLGNQTIPSHTDLPSSQPVINSYDPGRFPQNQSLPSPYQPSHTLPRPVPIGVWPVREQDPTQNSSAAAPAYPTQPAQSLNNGSAIIHQPEPWNGNTPNPKSKIQNPKSEINGGFASLPRSQATSSLGMNTRPRAMLPTINPMSSPPTPGFVQAFGTSSPQTPIAVSAVQQRPLIQSGQFASSPRQTNPVQPPTTTASPNGSLLQWQTGNLRAAHNSNPGSAATQSEAYRLYEQRLRNRNLSGRTVQQFPQTVPRQQPQTTIPTWRQYPQQIPSGQYSPRIGMQPDSQGVANGSTLR